MNEPKCMFCEKRQGEVSVLVRKSNSEVAICIDCAVGAVANAVRHMAGSLVKLQARLEDEPAIRGVEVVREGMRVVPSSADSEMPGPDGYEDGHDEEDVGSEGEEPSAPSNEGGK